MLARKTITLALALAFLSCSDDGGSNGDSLTASGSSSSAASSSSRLEDRSSSADAPSSSSGGTIKKAKITGVFQKGPFVQGTTATLNELDNDLNPTGRPYQTLITDDKGTFELRNVELVSPYAHLIASGFYRNEVTGNKSAAPIALQAIVNVTDRENVNVNVLTHLEYYRVLDLVDSGMTVKAAKKKAQKEIFAIFGIDSDSFKDSEDMSIFGTSESDAALLAISVLLLGNLSEADFTQRLMNLAQAVRNGTTWSEEEKARIADWAYGANLGSIKSNILAWGLSDAIPAFEKYVYGFWTSAYGLGVCNAVGWGNMSGIFVCKSGVWKKATYVDVRCSESKDCLSLADARDNKTYTYVTVGEQVWMAENLDYNASGSRCYNDSIAYCQTYGRMYDWNTALTACPNGWHLPNSDEWRELVDFAGGSVNAAKKLKAKETWLNEYDNLDAFGFAALAGGGDGNSAAGYPVGKYATWWASTEANGKAGFFTMHSGSNLYIVDANDSKNIPHSVRCVKGEPKPPITKPSSSSYDSSSSYVSSSSADYESSSSYIPNSSSSY